MKKAINNLVLCKPLKIMTIILIGMSGLFSSCMDSSPDTINTFTQEMMGQYLGSHTADFSEFNRLMDTTQVMGLINAYGKYTLFAPNNDAMRAFYKLKGRTSLKGFSLDTLKTIAYDHLIKGYVITTDKFIAGLMPYLTMSDRFVETSSQVDNSNFVFYVNKTSAILTKNILVSNGVIHMIDKVLSPSALTLVQSIAVDTRFKLFYEALTKTGLSNKLLLIRDDSYNPANYSYLDIHYRTSSGCVDQLPVSRKYGFTAFMESDSTYSAVYNIHSLDDLKAYAALHVYNEDPADASVTDITDPRNSLNKFIAYHLVNKKLPAVKLIDEYDTDHMIKTYDLFEYIETMNPNTLLEVKKERALGETNLINKSPTTGEVVKLVANDYDNDCTNGVYHEIDKILIYDTRVAGEMSSKRLRMDAAAFFPELTNNDMRIYNRDNDQSWVYPSGYLERLTRSETTYFSYDNAYGGWQDFEGDEFFLNGLYDFEIVTPAIPAGTYEVRFGYQPTGARGAAQLYWDHVPCGIPLDLTILSDNPLVGWVMPGSDITDPNGYENDKMMRNRGYMKGPSTYFDPLGNMYGKTIARNSLHSLRRILGTYTFTKAGTHLFTVDAVRAGQFQLDYLEFVPVELIDHEDVE
jgi:uncharacterized surface protein with fasciclin (FAS1) repeats